MKLEHNKSLLNLNSFHLDEYASEFVEVQSEHELIEILATAKADRKPVRILGGGSNVLITQKIESLVLHNQLKGLEIVQENSELVDIRFMSGEIWHSCVLWCVDHQFGGIENLSLIPGTIGAAPIQNIGAYGVELKDTFVQLEAVNINTLEKVIFNREQCAFGYRDSVFKSTERNHYFITAVTLRLQKHPVFHVEYGDIQKVLSEDFAGELSIRNISETIIKIRSSKLPDPNKIGNAGSFFKNPVVSAEQANTLKVQFPEMPGHQVDDGLKIPAAWLIEQCNWKGYNAGKFGVHDKQALVLVNFAGAIGSDILALSDAIITSVQQRFNIHLEREVNVW